MKRNLANKVRLSIGFFLVFSAACSEGRQQHSAASAINSLGPSATVSRSVDPPRLSSGADDRVAPDTTQVIQPRSNTPSQADRILAEEVRGTNEVWAIKQRASGRITACGLGFMLGLRDEVYRNGSPVVVSGSFTFLHSGNANTPLLWLLKLAPADLRWNEVSQKIDITPFDPKFGWISTRSASSQRMEARVFRCDGGGICIGGGSKTIEFLDGILLGDNFQIGFNRSEGRLDIQGQLDLRRPAKTRAARDELTGCLEELADEMGPPSRHSTPPQRPQNRT